VAGVSNFNGIVFAPNGRVRFAGAREEGPLMKAIALPKVSPRLSKA
jgi:hypothetical protein